MNQLVTQLMSQVILAEKTINIKLLGDSITHGVGGTGFEQDGETIVQEFARNTKGYCWANLFKEYMENQYNCKVINNACTGTNIEFIIENFKKLVDQKDDIVICTIGTNNRHQYFKEGPKRSKNEQMEMFYQNILKLHNLFKEAGIQVIFVANIPASADNECDKADFWRLLNMNDIHDLYMKASVACGFPFISLFVQFSEYCAVKGISVDSLLDDGLHPNNGGHEVICKLMLRELGLGRNLSFFK